ncbi:MAG TPA: D-glycero-beta-D-manno-heptose 1,7-bisphosphate 7-phosphatase [Gammaproteobacteria bacterium]|nr:D-glycero-beta-D-manno-heptose 1,7-bisphosphate 7-phosphatase [Gammaproteobacteria bacterium]
MLKLVILDRDGVINYDSPEYIKSPEEWHAIPGSLEAIARLNKAGFKVAIATNQSGVGRGYYSLDVLEKINQKMLDEMKKVDAHIDALFFCPHKPEDKCDCRKPKPGLLLKIADYLKIDLKEAVMVGDSPRDIQAAQAAGTDGILVGEEAEVPDLAHAVELILNLKTDFGADRFKKKVI